MSEPTIHLEDLVRDSDWAISLARRLVGDAHLAEDLRQEAWLQALSAESAPKSPRAWLTSVMRNLATSMQRSRDRRDRREQRAAHREEQPSAETIASRLEQQQVLGREVLALAPQFRDVVLLRFFEDMPPREIARVLELPLNTVYSRLSRGLSQLRERLDRQHGADGRSWVVALVPLLEAPTFAAPAAAISATVAGAIAVKTKLAAVAIAVIALVFAVQQFSDKGAPGEATPSLANATGSDRESAIDETTMSEDGVPLVTVDEASAGSGEVPTRHEAVAPSAPITGPILSVVVVDGNSKEPVAGATVRIINPFERSREAVRSRLLGNGGLWKHLGDPLAITDAAGRASLPRPTAREWMVVAEMDGSLGGHEEPIDATTTEVVLELHEYLNVPARVIDTRGNSLADVPVVLEMLENDRSFTIWRERTDSNGEAVLRHWSGQALEGELRVALGFPLVGSVAVTVGELPPVEPIVLTCPPTGQVEVIVTDTGEDFEKDAVVSLWLDGNELFAPLVGALHQPMANSIARFPRVGLHTELVASVPMRWDQTPILARSAGPQRDGETVRITLDGAGQLRHLSARLLHPDKQPLADTALHVEQLRAEPLAPDEPTMTTSAETDAAGQLELTLAHYRTRAGVVAIRLTPRGNRDPRIPIEAALPPARSQEGEVNLGDLVMGRSEPLVSGYVIDDMGDAIERHWVMLVRKTREGEMRASSATNEGWTTLEDSALTDAEGYFELFGASIPPGAYLFAQKRGPLVHQPISVVEGDRDVELVMSRANSLVGRLLLDPGIPAGSLDLWAWPTQADGRILWGTRGATSGRIQKDGAFGVHDLPPGDYTLAIGSGLQDRQPFLVEHISIGAAGTHHDPRLSPIDLRGRFVACTIDTHDEAGRKQSAQVYSLHAGDLFRGVGNSGRTLVFSNEPELLALLVQKDGFSPIELAPPTTPTVHVTLTRGSPLALRWSGPEEFVQAPYFVKVHLEAPGGNQLTSEYQVIRKYQRRWSTTSGRFDETGKLTLSVPDRGDWNVRLHLGVNINGYVDEVDLTGEAPRVVAAPAYDAAPAPRITADSTVLQEARLRLEAFAEKIRSRDGP